MVVKQLCAFDAGAEATLAAALHDEVCTCKQRPQFRQHSCDSCTWKHQALGAKLLGKL